MDLIEHVPGGKSPVGAYKRVEALQFFFMFSKQFLSYH